MKSFCYSSLTSGQDADLSRRALLTDIFDELMIVHLGMRHAQVDNG